jgi:tryptophan synthase beta chain
MTTTVDADTTATPNTFRTGPDDAGHFGLYGGRFVAETLMPLILELEAAYNAAKADPNSRPNYRGFRRIMPVAHRRSISLNG